MSRLILKIVLLVYFLIDFSFLIFHIATYVFNLKFLFNLSIFGFIEDYYENEILHNMDNG